MTTKTAETQVSTNAISNRCNVLLHCFSRNPRTLMFLLDLLIICREESITRNQLAHYNKKNNSIRNQVEKYE